MTNTKFRKRALLSSVAMLLVALVALGSATFAWFTSNPDANAQSLSIKATASKGLVIQTESAQNVAHATTWEHTDYLNCNSGRNGSAGDINAVAASINQADTFAAYTTTANADTQKDAKTDAVVSSATVYSDKIYCKLTGGEETGALALQSLTITATDINNDNTADSALAPAVRIAIYYHDGSASSDTFIGEYGISATNSETHITAVTTPGTTTYADATKENKAITAASSVSAVSLGTVDTSGDDYVTVYAYLDGEDTACFTNNISLSQIISNVNVALRVS